MITTVNRNQLDIEVSDSTVSFFPGTVYVGNRIIPYRGDQTGLAAFSSFGGDSSKYQNTAVYLQEYSGYLDMTMATSTPQDTIRELDFPTLSDSSNYRPLGYFTLWTPDGTNAELVSFSKVM